MLTVSNCSALTHYMPQPLDAPDDSDLISSCITLSQRMQLSSMYVQIYALIVCV